MGAEAGSMLAFNSFGLTASPTCAQTAEASDPIAFVLIAGSYGTVGGRLDDDPTRFRLRSYPRGAFEELAADEEILPGLTASQLCGLDGYRAIPPVAALDIVLLVGSEDTTPTATPEIAATFADALEDSGVDAELVVVPGGNHDTVVDPTTEAGQATLSTVAEVLAGAS